MGKFNYCLALIMIVSSCTSFQEEDVPDRLSVSVTELSYSKAGENLQVKVSSGTKWDVTSSPDWVSLQSISSGHSPYEWTVNFSASANDDYNREGKITIKAGSDIAEISVTQDGKKGKYIAVESVSLSPTELTLTEGETASLNYTISPANASIQDVVWRSNASSVATVTAYTGQIEAIAEGKADISVTTSDGNKTAICAVMVKAKVIPVTGVSLDWTSLSLTEGETYSLVATVTPSNATNKSVTWSSSNTTVATVSSSGVVTAKAAGSATITVKTADGSKTATCAVTVKAKTISVTGVSLNKTSLTMTVGDTQTLTATVTPSNASNKSVTWSSSNTSVATVSSSGVVTAKAAGSATITVTTNDGGKKATCSVTIQAQKVAVTGVSLNMNSFSLVVGHNVLLSETVLPSNATDKTVRWSSSDPTVATVVLYSGYGLVTAKMPGSATITVTTNDGGMTATCQITVTPEEVHVTGVTLNKTSLSMVVGDKETLIATVLPADASNKSVQWASNDHSIATVSNAGVVTAKSPGNAAITVITDDGNKTASCFVTVKEEATDGSENGHDYVDLGHPSGVKWASCNLGASKPEEFGDYFDWGETEPKYENIADDGTVTWKSGYEAGHLWSTYKWCEGSETTLTKYNTRSSYGTVDNKTVLEAGDDAATVNLGGTWRTPTEDEWAWLRTNCTWTWTADYNDSGIAGQIVTSNVEGYTENSIFLPAAGCLGGTDFVNVGVYGIYWSSSLDTSIPYMAWRIYFSSDGVGRSNSTRSLGHPIRPVCD